MGKSMGLGGTIGAGTGAALGGIVDLEKTDNIALAMSSSVLVWVLLQEHSQQLQSMRIMNATRELSSKRTRGSKKIV